MRRILFLILLSLMILLGSFSQHNLSAETRQKPNVIAYTADTLIKIGEARVKRVDYVVTAANGGWTLYDSLTADKESNVKAEGSKAVSKDDGTKDFTKEPLEFSTGLYLNVNNCNVVITWD